MPGFPSRLNPTPPNRAQPVPAAPAIPAIPSHWRFPADPASVGQARQAVVEALPHDSGPQLIDTLRLLTSELVTNAIRHGARPAEDHLVELALWPADGHYWLAVSDPGDGRPALGSPRPGACGGRGLVLVDALSVAWAVIPRRTCGKSVVAGVRLDGA